MKEIEGERLLMKCLLCSRPIRYQEAWKSSSNHYYCSEFCAESEAVDLVLFSGSPDIIASRYERMERLLPYMRDLHHWTSNRSSVGKSRQLQSISTSTITT
jgi:hypothetical protein